MNRKRPHKRFELENLEPRILLSGDPLLGAIASLAPADPDSEESPLSTLEEVLTSEETDAYDSPSADSESYDPGAPLDDIFSGLTGEDLSSDDGEGAAEPAETDDATLPIGDHQEEQILHGLTELTRLGETLEASEVMTSPLPGLGEASLGGLIGVGEILDSRLAKPVYDYFGDAVDPPTAEGVLEALQNSLNTLGDLGIKVSSLEGVSASGDGTVRFDIAFTASRDGQLLPGAEETGSGQGIPADYVATLTLDISFGVDSDLADGFFLVVRSFTVNLTVSSGTAGAMSGEAGVDVDLDEAAGTDGRLSLGELRAINAGDVDLDLGTAGSLLEADGANIAPTAIISAIEDSAAGAAESGLDADGGPSASSAATINLPDLDLGSGDTTVVNIGGTTAGTDYDQIVVAGDADLGGTLEIVLTGGFTPGVGDIFEVITYGSATGVFSDFTGLDLGGGLEFVPIQGPGGVLLITAPAVGAAALLVTIQTELDKYISGANPVGVDVTVNVPSVDLAGFLRLVDLKLVFTNVTVSGGQIDAGSVTVEAGTALFFPGQPLFIGATDGADGDFLAVVGTYDPVAETFSLVVDQLDVNVSGLFTAHAETVTVTYDANGAADQTLVTIASADFIFQALADTTVLVEDVTIRKDGFSIATAVVLPPDAVWVDVFELTGISLTLTNVDYSTGGGGGFSAGTITVAAATVSVFENQPSFSSTVTGFSGSYDFVTGALSLSADTVDLNFAGLISASGEDVTFDMDPVADTLSVEAGLMVVNIGQFVNLSGSFSFQSGELLDVDLVGGGSKEVSLVTVGATGVRAFVGAEGPYWVDSNGSGVIDGSDAPETDSVGFAMSGLDFGLALLTPTNAGDSARYYALETSLTSFEGVFQDSAVAMSGELSVRFNLASEGNVIDFSQQVGGNLPVPTGAAPVEIDFSADLFAVEGGISIDLAGYVVGTADFSFGQATTDVDTSNGALGILSDASLQVISLSSLNLFAGTGASLDVSGALDVTGAVGFAITAGVANLAIVRPGSPAANDQTSYLGLELSLGGASLVGIPGVTMTASGSVLVNRATAANGSEAADRIDWANATDNAGLVTGVFSAELTESVELSATGDLAMDLGGFVVAIGSLSLTKGQVSGTDGTTVLAGAGALSFSLTNVNLFVGVGAVLDDGVLADDVSDDLIVTTDAVGFSVAGASLSLAIVEQGGVTYTGTEFTLDGIALVGISDLTLKASGLEVQVNQVDGAAQKLDWAAMGPGLTSGSLPAFTMDDTVDLQASGSVSVDVAGFVVAVGTLDLFKGRVSGSDGTTDLVDADALSLSLSNLSLFVGVGASINDQGTPDAVGNDTIDEAGAVGFSVAVANLDLVVVTAGAVRYTALELDVLSTGLVGVPNVTFEATDLNAQVNLVDGGAQKLDWDGLVLTSGSLPALTVDVGIDFAVSGSVSLDVFGVVTGTADFSIAQGTADVDTGNGNLGVAGTLEDASVFAVTLSNLNLFIGDSGIGFSVTGGAANLAIVTATDGASYMGLELSLVAASLDGVPGVTLAASGAVLVNRATAANGSEAPDRIDWADATDPAGVLPAFSVELTEAVELKISGTAVLDLSGFVVGTATFSVTQGSTTVTDNSGFTVAGDLLLFTLTNGNLFAGTGAVSMNTEPSSRRFRCCGSSAADRQFERDNLHGAGSEYRQCGSGRSPGLTLTVQLGTVLINHGSTANDDASGNGLLAGGVRCG